MFSYLVNRVFQAIGVLLVVALLSFVIFNYVGDPINNMVGQEATLEDREELRERLGLNDSVIVQFVRFVANAAEGEFGISYQFQRRVSDLILERMPATLELVFVSAIFALAAGIGLGVYTGLRRDSWLSRFVLTVSLVGVSLPTFVIGILLIYIFSVTLEWLPSFGRGDTVRLGNWNSGLLTGSGWLAIILPAITLGLFQLTIILRLVRAEMLEVLRTDYIKFARARGLSRRAVNFGHALKNTMVPVITIAGLQIGTLIAFSIITETVFQWPGMGLLFIQGVEFADVPIMGAYSAARRHRLRRHQPGRRSALRRRRSASARLGPARDGNGMTAGPASGAGGRLLGALTRGADSDLAYSFRRNPVVVTAAIVTLLYFFGAAFADWIARTPPSTRRPSAWAMPKNRRPGSKAASGAISSAPTIRAGICSRPSSTAAACR